MTPVKDFSAVAGIADIPHVLVVRRGLDADNVGALISLAKKSPGGLNYASTGVGSASHLAAELFKTRAGVELQHIPFRGSAPMTTELLAGRIDLTFATLPSVISQSTPARSALWPSQAQSARRGCRTCRHSRKRASPGVEADAWFALFAPAKTPAAIVERLYRAVSAGLTTDAATKAIAAQGMSFGAANARGTRRLAARRSRQMGGGDQGGGRRHGIKRPAVN